MIVRPLFACGTTIEKEPVRLRSSTASRALRTESEPQISKKEWQLVLSKCQVNRLPLDFDKLSPSRRAKARRLPLTMVESKVELLPTLLSTTKPLWAAWGKQNESLWFLE